MFDTHTIRTQLDDLSGIAFHSGQRLNDVAQKNAVTSSSRLMLLTALECALVDYNTDGKALLAKTREWLKYAIATEEKPRHYFPASTEAGRYEDLALCSWLLSNDHDHVSSCDAVRWQDISFAEDGIQKQDLINNLPMYFDAGAFERVIKLCESTLKVPASLSRITNEGAMCYVLAKSRLEESYSANEVDNALNRFLQKHIPRALNRGHYIDAARWMKIAFWNDRSPRLSAIETVKLCLKYLNTAGT